MKILHTADLHLGRQFERLSLEEDHAAVLDRIVAVLLDSRADVLVIAGDVFDRAVPPVHAVKMFNDFLSRVTSESDAAVVIIAGNHDSGERISMMSTMPDTRRALVRGMVSAEERPLVIRDEHGPVAFSGLPFCYENAACECFGDEGLRNPEDVLKAQVTAARGHVPEGARWVVVAHAFVAGALGTEGEKPLAKVGGIETVSPVIFEGAHYVALGHLHRPQSAGADHIRYSGAPLAFGFDEAESVRSMTLVEMDGAGAVTIETVPFEPLRQVRILRGRHAELMAGEPTEDIVKIVLTDAVHVIDGMKRVRDIYPNACILSYERDERAPETKAYSMALPVTTNPLDMVGGFLDLVRDEELSDREREVVATALGAIRRGEDAA